VYWIRTTLFALAASVSLGSHAQSPPYYKVFPVTDQFGNLECYQFAYNASGFYIGYSNVGNDTQYFVAKRNGPFVVLTDPPGMAATSVYGLSDNNYVAGGAYIFSNGKTTACLWKPDNSFVVNGTPVGFQTASNRGVNSHGETCGQASNSNGGTAFRWDSQTGFTTLPPLAGFTTSGADFVTETGAVYGRSSKVNGEAATRWNLTGGPVALPPLPGYTDCAVSDVTSSGSPYGSSFSGGGSQVPTRWVNDQPLALPILQPYPLGAITGARDDGFLVGSCGSSSFVRACIWSPDGTVTDLNTRIDPSTPGWMLQYCVGIADDGSILGIGTYNGRDYTYCIAEPVGETTVDVETLVVNLGFAEQGDQYSLNAVDGDCLRIAKFVVPNLPNRIQVTVAAHVPFSSMSSLALESRGRVSCLGSFVQLLEVYDFSANRFDPVDRRTDPIRTTFGTVRLDATGGVGRYRRQADGLVRARYTVSQTGISAVQGWASEHDLLRWRINP